MVECQTPEREVRGWRPTAAVLCPWARHFTPRKYWLITQEAMAPSRHDWKIVDWDVKPQHNQPTNCSWASLLGILPVLSAHSLASNWQLLFLNRRKRENGHRNFFMTKSPRKKVLDMGSENRLKNNITPVGEIFIIWLNEIKFKIWLVTFLKSFLPQRNYGMDFRFSGNIACALMKPI